MEPNLDARVEGHRAYELRADNSRKGTNVSSEREQRESHACSVGECMYGAARAGNPPLGWHGRWQAVLSVLHERLSHSLFEHPPTA